MKHHAAAEVVLAMNQMDDGLLAVAGQAANWAFQYDAFATYRATCRPNTRRRHSYDLQAFSAFLASFGV